MMDASFCNWYSVLQFAFVMTFCLCRTLEDSDDCSTSFCTPFSFSSSTILLLFIGENFILDVFNCTGLIDLETLENTEEETVFFPNFGSLGAVNTWFSNATYCCCAFKFSSSMCCWSSEI